MPFSDAILQTMAKNARSLASAIQHEQKRIHTQRRQEVRDILQLYYGRQMDMLATDIRTSYEDEEDIRQLMVLRCVNNIMRRALTKSSLAFSEAPVLKIGQKGDEGAAELAAEDPSIPDPVMPDMISEVTAAAAGQPSKPFAPQAGPAGPAATPAAEAQSVRTLTNVWNERIDPDRRMWETLREVEPLSYAVNDVVVMAAWRPVGGEPRMTWPWFTPDNYQVIQELEAPSRAAVLSLDQYFDDTDPEVALLNTSSFITRAFRLVWTHENVYAADPNTGKALSVMWFPEELTGDKNPYGFIPAVTFRSSLPDAGGFYGAMAEDLMTINRQTNLMATEIRLVEKYQGFPILWASGLAEEDRDSLHASPNSVVLLTGGHGDEKPAIGYAKADAPIDVLQKRRTSLLLEAARNYDLDPKTLLDEGSSSRIAPSGKALQVMSQDLIERTDRYRELNNGQLVELVKMTLMVWKRWNSDDPDAALIPEDMDDLQVEVKYPPITRATDNAELFALRLDRIEHGLETLVDLYMEEHPEVDDPAEAERRIMANRQVNQRLGAGAQMFNAALQQLQAAQGGFPPPEVDPATGKPVVPPLSSSSSPPQPPGKPGAPPPFVKQ